MKSAKKFLPPTWACSLALCLLASGCGSDGDSSLVSIQGTVTHMGSPLAGATVTFHAPEGKGNAFGLTDADGVYSLTTAPGNRGAHPGDYAVTITKVEISGGDNLPEDHPDYGKKPIAKQSAKSILPKRYGDPKSSELTAKIEEKSTTIDFELDAK